MNQNNKAYTVKFVIKMVISAIISGIIVTFIPEAYEAFKLIGFYAIIIVSLITSILIEKKFKNKY